MTHLKNQNGKPNLLQPTRQCSSCVHFVKSAKSVGRGMCTAFNQLVGSTDECPQYEAQKQNQPSGRVQRA